MKNNNFSWTSCILTSAGIGFIATVSCMLLFGGWNEATRELLIWLSASVLFGIASGLFFRKEDGSLLTATALHFVCCLGIAAGAGWLCGYAEGFLTLLGAMIPVFLAVYAVVYLAFFFAMKREAARVNRNLKAE